MPRFELCLIEDEEDTYLYYWDTTLTDEENERIAFEQIDEGKLQLVELETIH